MNVDRFRRLILDWHKDNRRDMPWRNTTDPYRILVSEVMLQQTQVARVVPKYQHFLGEFPDAYALSKASDADVLAAWQGLGYWRRALNLKKTAAEVVQKYGGEFPRDTMSLQEFPGIGPYTAGAVACFAFGSAQAFLDTNIRRVYLHFFFPGDEAVSDDEIVAIAQEAVWKQDPREWHYAVFDYGALVLKDKSLNRRSSRYHKQSAFNGSFRSYRTKAVRYILRRPDKLVARNDLEELLRRQIHVDGQSWSPSQIMTALVKDGLIKESGDSYAI